MPSNFCILPFTHLSTRVDGNVAPCCRSLDTLGNVNESSLEEIWNGENMQKLRKQFLDNERPEGCKLCWDIEDRGNPSMRQTRGKTVQTPSTVDVTMPFEIPILELKLSNLCNFRCRTCKPDLSTTWLKDWDAVKDEYDAIGMKYSTGRQENYDTDDLLEEIVKLGPSFRIIEFAGGEPLMDPMHYRVLDALQPFAHNIQVKYSTNLSKLTYGRYNALEAWTKFKGVDISLSVDGHPALNEYIRTESNNKVLEENVALVKKELNGKLDGRAALCYSAWNAIGLPESYDYFLNTLQMPVHGNIAWSPSFISAQVLPLELKSIITEKYTKYLEKEKDKRVHRFINTNMQFLNAKDESHLFEQFVRFSTKLDATRNTKLYDVIPELEKYV